MKEDSFFRSLQAEIDSTRAACKSQYAQDGARELAFGNSEVYKLGFADGYLSGLKAARARYYVAGGKDYRKSDDTERR